MENLTGKEKRTLRGIGQRLKTAVTVGKSGLNPSVIEHIGIQFTNNELLKIRLTDQHGSQRKEIAAKIAAATNSTCVGITGKTLLLYKPNPNSGKE
ncbi:MAG: YhbY family RNA-binding protein [Phycisphaerae bacterium]|nr:YhbY family RNA-binding protein [Phycisphaerae bacterium]